MTCMRVKDGPRSESGDLDLLRRLSCSCRHPPLDTMLLTFLGGCSIASSEDAAVEPPTELRNDVSRSSSHSLTRLDVELEVVPSPERRVTVLPEPRRRVG